MISKLIIKNYRSIEHCELSLGQLTALVGENNAGKSNILRALKTVLAGGYLKADSFSDEDFYNFETEREIEISLHLDPPIQYKKYDYQTPVDIGIINFKLTTYKVNARRGEKGDRRLEQKCLKPDGDQPFLYRKNAKPEPIIDIPQEVREKLPLIFIGIDRRLKDQLPNAQFSILRRLFGDIDEVIKSKQINPSDPESKTVHDLFTERLASALEVLRVDEFNSLETDIRHHAMVNLGLDPQKDSERLKFTFDLFDSFDFLKAINLRFSENGRTFDATEMGDGAQNALVLSIFQAFEKRKKEGATILIEEPEMFLHPHRRRLFYETLRKISEKNQIIYTTHATEFLSLPNFEEIGLVRKQQNGSTTIQRSSIKIDKLHRERLRKEVDYDRAELFFARHVILVEGPSEKLALPVYAQRMNIDFNSLGVSVIETSGKRNINTFVEILSSFAIPFTLVFDTDSSDFDKKKKDEEEKFNASFRNMHGTMCDVYEIDSNYEDLLRKTFGDDQYQQICSQYPNTSKPLRARLIAADSDLQIPDLIQNIVKSVIPESSAELEDNAIVDDF